MSRTKIRLLETDFKKRIAASLGESLCRGVEDIQVIPIPIDDPTYQTRSWKEHFFSTKTEMGLDLILFAKTITTRHYMSPFYALAALSVSNTVVPIFVEGALILDSPTPFPILVNKKGLNGRGPVQDLVRVDNRFRILLESIKDEVRERIPVGNTNIRLNLDMSFETGVFPLEAKTVIGMRSLADCGGFFDNLAGVLQVLSYGFPRPTIELLGRLAYYTKHLDYSGKPHEQIEDRFLIQELLKTTGILQECK